MDRQKKERKNDQEKNNDHAFSEELSDGGIRDEIIKKQSSPKSCGGL
ncbi:hypothetical protein HNQ94_003421 [Salirhabdus euzebyi]|uniref:Uncharacterized protein n=1 Tax=Salirhabdus euzebyi TaxID=394506 RepID=A0A841Q9L7_9BACI|nr:hypothetical protein [Salirhabdus euzebyi]MBB6454932.1 hypothetical protein [Salirhabdus euzebyi]